MSIDVQFDKGSWWHRTADLEFCLTTEPAEADVELLMSLVEHRDKLVASARSYARNSPYSSDIDDCGGMSPSMIVVPEDHRFVVWFRLRNSDRSLGVRFVGDDPIDVYCDHP